MMELQSKLFDRRARLATVPVAAIVVSILVSAEAQAHGLGTEDPNRPVLEYLWLGTKHLLAGWDHLLFILAVVIVSGSLWRATKMMSLFVLGHSLTLGIATFQEWQVSTTFVDVVIALSVVAVAVAGLRTKEMNWQLFGTGLFVFGLIHGLGLSTRLQELGVSDDQLVWRVLLFNLGIEIGQAIAVLAFVALGRVFVRVWLYPEKMRQPAFTMIGTAGLIGAMLLTFPSGESLDSTAERLPPTAATAASNCTVIEVDAENPQPGGTHPEKRFYGPDEEYPELDFGHVMLDGYVVVTYQPELGQADVDELRNVVDSGQEGLLAGAEAGQEKAVVATTLRRVLRCDELDTDALVKFKEEWVAEFTS